jgi:uncharacterized protein (UPF0332 family)
MNEIEKLIKKADEDIKAAELLISEGYHRIAVSRLYYAMFYITEAILLTKNLSYSSHHAVISFFNKEFVKTGVFDKKYYESLEMSFNLRQNSDYEIETVITEQQAKNILSVAKKFLETAKKYLGIK